LNINNLEDAHKLFEKWYEACLGAGLEPEETVSIVGVRDLLPMLN
tara:strand:- start:1483 stop:1617 length:135 start_codon:yes stop_codon:yes gene_type:complete